jgi:hypothetical protein
MSSGSEKQQIIYQLLREENVFDPENPEKLISAIAPEVLACNFYALSEESGGSSAGGFLRMGIRARPHRQFSISFQRSIPIPSTVRRKNPKSRLLNTTATS